MHESDSIVDSNLPKPALYAEIAAQVAEGKIRTEPMITGRIALDEIVRGGFEALLREKDRHAKILVSPA